jgi:hypothetical protein
LLPQLPLERNKALNRTPLRAAEIADLRPLGAKSDRTGCAAALRRSELAAVEREHLRFTADRLKLLLLAATAAAAAWCGTAPPGYRDAAPVPALAG